MAPKDRKLEALRLDEAKRAIKKMKLKRRELKKQPEPVGKVRPEPKPFQGFTKEELKDFHRQKVSKLELPKSKRSKGVLKPFDVGSHTSQTTDLDDSVFCDTGSEGKSEPMPITPELVLRTVKKTYSRKSSTADNDLPVVKLCEFTASNQKEPSLPEFCPSGCSTAESKLPKMRVKRSSLGKVKKRVRARIPMSISMMSTTSEGPMFKVVHDDSCDDVESEDAEEVLCAQVSRVSCLDNTSKKFSVTTVNDSILSVSDATGEEDESLSENGSVVEQLVEMESKDTLDELEDCDSDSNVQRSMENPSSGAHFHFIDGEVVLHLKHPSNFVFCGQVDIEVLKGTVDILGYRMSPSGDSHTVFSPRGSSLLTITTILSDEDDDSQFTTLNSSAMTTVSQECCVGDAILLMKKADSILPLFLDQYVSTKLFPQVGKSDEEDNIRKAAKKLNCIFKPPSSSLSFQKGEGWDDISDEISKEQSGCTVLCGGKGVGKSTMLRFLVNSLLSSGKEEIVLIDLDPGQSELTMPGCVSLSVIRKPLLGPNFTHLQNPERCIYIGDVNVANCVPRYMDACVTIISQWQSEDQFKGKPCLVNTMGFNKGLGVTLMVQILAILQPSTVIQIMSKFMSRNYPEQLTIDYVKRNCSNSPFRAKLDMQMLTLGRRISYASSINYDLHIIYSAAESSTQQRHQWGLDARSQREISTLSYFAQVVTPPQYSLLEVVPFCCPLDAVYLNICHESVPPPITLSVFNASLVAMCKVNPKEEDIVHTSEPGLPSVIKRLPTADCLGFGIVRGIDMDSKQIFLLTPLSPSALIEVNCLVVGALVLPDCVLLTPPKEPGSVPYATFGESHHTARPSKRTFKFQRVTGRK